MEAEKYSLIGECCDSYHVTERGDGKSQIVIVIPRRFRDLWISKLSDLTTTDAEIADFEPHP